MAVLAMLCAACATDQDLKQYERDGVLYGQTEGSFRGRWWNYYERGRSFQDGRFLKEAERDLRTALAGRSRDQLWARTYGLHLLREYFPNRELGIALFYQDRIDEAIPLLEKSWQQQPSARAAFFLDEARARSVQAANTDRDPPSLELISPGPLDSLHEMETRIVAIARDDTYVRSISIDGEIYPVRVSAPEIRIEHPIVLTAGLNRISVVVTDVIGRVQSVEIQLTTDLDGPAVSFDEPVVLPGVVSGVVYDPAGVSSFTIAGRPATLTDDGRGVMRFEADLATTELSPPLRFRCEDALGNVTQGPVPVGTLVVSNNRGPIALASAPLRVRVAENIDAILINGEVAALTLAAAPDDLDLRFTNLREGLQFLKDEIIVAMRVYTPNGIESIELNGVPVDTMPGRRAQHVSRRILLEQDGANLIVARLQDIQGERVEKTITVQRRLTEVEQLSERLSVALLGNVWMNSSPGVEGESEFIVQQLGEILYERQRFDLVTREVLDEVLQEQELIAGLGSRKDRESMARLVPAELLVVGSLRRSGENLEIKLHAIDSATSLEMGYTGVSGTVTSIDDLYPMVDKLSILFEQMFPLVEGRIIDVASPRELYSDLNALQGLKKNMRCLVFRKGVDIVDPDTLAVLGSRTTIIAEGTLSQVQNTLSTITLFEPAEGEASEPIEVKDYVITK